MAEMYMPMTEEAPKEGAGWKVTPENMKVTERLDLEDAEAALRADTSDPEARTMIVGGNLEIRRLNWNEEDAKHNRQKQNESAINERNKPNVKRGFSRHGRGNFPTA